MARKYSLAHLTALGCSPPEMTYMARDLGFDLVGYRLIPLNLPGEPRYVLTENKAMLQDTRRALAETGLKLLDIEIARIADGVDINVFAPTFEVAASLGAKHVLASSGASDFNFTIDAFGRLCDLGAQYGLTLDFEFIAFSSVPTLAKTMELLRAVNRPNAGVLIDTLHMGLSRIPPEELDAVPPHLMRYAQLNDARPSSPTPPTEEMINIARENRLYLGEGAFPVKAIVEHMPKDTPLALEITHKKRIEELGYREYARQCLATAKAYLGDI